MRPKRKWHKLLIIFFILLLIVFSFYNFFYGEDELLTNNEEISKLIKKAEYMQDNSVTSGITYYVSQDGTSMNGTDINNPMSFDTANTKKYHSGDKVLFKRGDTFYGILNFEVDADENNMFYVGSYGDENLEKPRINGSAVLINLSAWVYEDGLYKLDMSNEANFIGIDQELKGNYNVGAIIDESGEIHGNRKNSKDLVSNNLDFYCEDQYLYLKCDSNPGQLLGKISITYQNKLVCVSSNMIIDGIIIENTGVHGIVKKQHPISNVCIINCVIQNIGGSYTSSGQRYGNGIEFWHQAKNTIVQNCVIRNVYDAGYTCQGSSVTDGFYNNVCTDNVFINCTYTFEFFCHKNYTYEGIHFSDTQVENNIVINQGKGWGFEAREDKYQPADLVIWEIVNEEGGLTYRNNRLYNSRAMYYKYPTVPMDTYKSLVDSDENTYYNNSNTIAFISDQSYKDISKLTELEMDTNSNFYTLSDPEIEEISNPDILNSNDYDEIKTYYDKFDVKYRNSHATENIIPTIGSIINDEKYTGILQNNEISLAYEELKKAVSNLSQNIDIINVDSVSYSYECLYNFINTIKDKFLNNEINMQKDNFIELVSQLDSVSNEYKDIYSYYITEDNTSLDTIKNMLNNTIDKYNNNLDLDIGYLENIITTAKNLYNNSITTDNVSLNVLNKQRIINITNFANSIIDLKINEFVELEKQKIKVEFDKDTTTPTNENITATLIVGDNTIIKNNGGSNKHIFEKNETFTYELEIKGVIFNVQVTISNINKDYTIEEEYITNIGGNTQILDFKDNLGISNFTFKRDDELVNINEDIVKTGDIITFNNKSYTLIVSGDINSDGGCTIKDIVSYRKYLLKYSEYSNIQFKAADINQDNELTIKDLVGIRELLLN